MGFKGLKPIVYGGREVWPLVEGGKGVAATNHMSSGAWAAAGGIGTVSAVNADSYDAEGKIVPQVYNALTRKERHQELIDYAIDGAVEQVRRAYEISGGKGAGMPYKLSEIAARFNVNYLPIVSSGRAFRALWKRAYHKVPDLMGAVVYEDPWLAGGHNGLSNAEDPLKPEDPYPRVKALRDTMRAEGIADSVPIVMAGGVWFLRDWENWIDNPELGSIAFQYGTRPLLTQESPIPQAWKDHLRTLEPGDVLLHRFSPTGFYSSAVRNPFLRNLEARSERQIPYSKVEAGEHTVRLDVGVKGKNFWVAPKDLDRARAWSAQGFTDGLRTPDDTIIFVNPAERDEIRKDQADCMGCLSHCGFSSWKDHDDYTTGRLADPRSFCIQKTLQDIAHGGPIDENLMFAGHAAYKFKQDPFYSNGYTPTVKELGDRILTGD